MPLNKSSNRNELEESSNPDRRTVRQRSQNRPQVRIDATAVKLQVRAYLCQRGFLLELLEYAQR